VFLVSVRMLIGKLRNNSYVPYHHAVLVSIVC